MYNQNPPRKCGTKKEDSYYLESGEISIDGALHAWSWLLGDGLTRNITFSKQEVPPRQVVGVNPIMTILFESYIPADGPPIPVPETKKALYEQLIMATKTPGLADHVGDQYYSAWEFYLETAELGLSRRIPKTVAATLAELISIHGPLPVMLSHSQVPVFRSEEEMAKAMDHVNATQTTFYRTVDEAVSWEGRWMSPTWTHDNWGQYHRRDHWIGSSHYMIPILAVVDDLKNKWQTYKEIEEWQAARKFFNGLRYVKQTFGMSWMCQVSYTLPFKGEADEEVYNIPGINIIDLKETGVEDEQTEKASVGAD